VSLERLALERTYQRQVNRSEEIEPELFLELGDHDSLDELPLPNASDLAEHALLLAQEVPSADHKDCGEEKKNS